MIPDEDEDDELPRDADLFQVVRQVPQGGVPHCV